MCEYCGCQDVAAIGELTREHDAVVDLIGEARAAHRVGDLRALAECAARIAALLGPHTRVEEEGLFPALRDEFPDQIAKLEAEHRMIEPALFEAAYAPIDGHWPTRLMAALDVLRRHILKEQDGVFPFALTGLTVEQWEAVDAVRAQAGTALPVPQR